MDRTFDPALYARFDDAWEAGMYEAKPCLDCGTTGGLVPPDSKTPGRRPCSVEGCDSMGAVECELCCQYVCGKHSRTVLMMSLCFSCAIGLSEGMTTEQQ